MKFTQDDLTVTLAVKLQFVITCGAYGGTINREMMAEHIRELLASTDIDLEGYIESHEILEVALEDGTMVVGA